MSSEILTFFVMGSSPVSAAAGLFLGLTAARKRKIKKKIIIIGGIEPKAWVRANKRNEKVV